MADIQIQYDRELDNLMVLFEFNAATSKEIAKDVFEHRRPDGQVMGYTIVHLSQKHRRTFSLPFLPSALNRKGLGLKQAFTWLTSFLRRRIASHVDLLGNEQAYEVMFTFLESFWRRHKEAYSDDLPLLLSGIDRHAWRDGILLRYEGESFDNAYDAYWARLTQKRSKLTADETFMGMIAMLEIYRALGEGEPKDITRLLDELEASPAIYQVEWNKVVQQILAGDPATA